MHHDLQRETSWGAISIAWVRCDEDLWWQWRQGQRPWKNTHKLITWEEVDSGTEVPMVVTHSINLRTEDASKIFIYSTHLSLIIFHALQAAQEAGI